MLLTSSNSSAFPTALQHSHHHSSGLLTNNNSNPHSNELPEEANETEEDITNNSIGDSRSRFSHTKALFEQLERCGSSGAQLPSFYSPRLQRATSSGLASSSSSNIISKSQSMPPLPPVVPPKPQLNVVANSNKKLQSQIQLPSSPCSLIARNFAQLAKDLDELTSPETPSRILIPNYDSKASLVAPTMPAQSSLTTNKLRQNRNTHIGNGVEREDDEATSKFASVVGGSCYEPYWRDPEFYKRRFGSTSSSNAGNAVERNVDVNMQEEENNSSESSDSVPSEPRPSQQQQHQFPIPLTYSTSRESKSNLNPNNSNNSTGFALIRRQTNNNNSVDALRQNNENQNERSSSGSGLFETTRGLSPERSDALNRKVSFSTAPIKVFKAHGILEYDRKNEEIDPVASCAEYELERRLDKMQLFDVDLIKGPEGLGVSIIGMGVGADSGLEKLGIFVKSIAAGGAVHRNGRVRVCDQIVSVDGVSLVGVSQLFAAQTLRATGNKVTFTIGREASLVESEVAQLIQQSLEQDRIKLLLAQQQQQQPQQPIGQKFNEQIVAANHSSGAILNNNNSFLQQRNSSPATSIHNNSHSIDEEIRTKEESHQTNSMNQLISSNQQNQIKVRIQTLEQELTGSQKKTERMCDVLENTRTHYSQLENKYDMARKLLKDYQEREKELLEREETQLVQIREKDAHYGILVEQLKSRIDELEGKLNQVANQRSTQMEGELTDLRKQLDACTTESIRQAENNYDSNNKNIDHLDSNDSNVRLLSQQPIPENEMSSDGTLKPGEYDQVTPSTTNTKVDNDVKRRRIPGELLFQKAASRIGKKRGRKLITESSPVSDFSGHYRSQSRHAGLSQREIPLSTALPTSIPLYERFLLTGRAGTGGHIYSGSEDLFDERYMFAASRNESPIPRISEPTSPAMPSKFLSQHQKMMFPLRKRFIQAENEFWREDVEAQGLQVLQWSSDEVCQLLIHIGLDKYIPEFTVNQINGPKFLDLDGNKLKAMGIYNHTDRSIIKKKVKTIKGRIERERKLLEKESRQRPIKLHSILQ